MNTKSASPFSCEAWERNARAYEVIRTMPFNAELAAGILSAARFKHYITQDAHYLIGFGRALSLGGREGAEAGPHRAVRQGGRRSRSWLSAHCTARSSTQYGITPQIFAETPLSPACHHYVSYLMATAYASPTRWCSARFSRASGSMRRWGATSMPAPRPPIRIRPGSTPMRARNSTPLCAR